MAASRLTKQNADSAVPYLWNALPTLATAIASHHQGTAHDPLPDKEAQEQYHRGYRDGEAVGKAAKVDEAVEQLEEGIANLAMARSALFRASQADVLHLAVAVARRILHREIMMSPDVLGGVISVALDRIEEAGLLTLRVHPSFVDRIAQYLSARTGRKVKVVADPSLPLGGSVFETEHGDIDAGLESQLSEIERGLADHLEVLR